MARKEGRDRGIFERPKDSGVWWIRYHDQHGREHREKVGPKKLATGIYQKRKNEVREGRFDADVIRRRDVLLSDQIDAVLETSKDLRSHKDNERYGKRWKRELGRLALRQVRPGDVRRVGAALRAESLGDQTVYHYLSFLRRVFSLAKGDGLVERNPVVKLKAPDLGRIRYLTEDEEQRLFANLAPLWHPHVLIALHTGMRSGEQFGLRWSQVDLQVGVIQLTKTKTKPRVVELNATAKAAFRSLPRHLHIPWVFVAQREGHRFRKPAKMNALNFYQRTFKAALLAAKIEGFTWHDLRHTFASRLVMAGIELPTVRDLMGHKSIAMTMRYAHLAPGRRARAVSVLDGQRKKPSGTETGTEGNA